MANPQHLEILSQGVEVWNRWQKTNFNILPDLSNHNFENAEMPYIDLRNVLLNGSNFTNANFYYANFVNTVCHKTNFTSAYFSNAQIIKSWFDGASFVQANCLRTSFHDSILNGANFEKCHLEQAIFKRVLLDKTNFSEATLARTSFDNCDLSPTIGLETARHLAPNSIGIDTLYLSKGYISEEYLKKSGIPENFVTYSKSLTSNPIEFYDCFISFTEKDDVFSKKIYDDLIRNNVRCWRWIEDAKGGKPLRISIDEAIKVHEKVVVICSKSSLNSPAVIEEIEKALNKEDAQIREGKDGEVLFPITIDDYVFNWDHPLKDRVKRPRILDFRGWNSESEKYRISLECLVRDLNKFF
jgi:hypothetical protein